MRLVPILLMLCLALSACAPAPEEDTETEWTPLQMAQAIWESQGREDGTILLSGSGGYETYLAAYGLEATQVTDGAIMIPGGASAWEVAILCVAEDGDPAAAAAALEDYAAGRVGAFTGYLPEEAALLEDAEVTVRGNHVALLVCGDMDAALTALDRAFLEAPPADALPFDMPEPPAADPLPWAEPPELEAETEEAPLPDGEPAPTPPLEGSDTSVAEQTPRGDGASPSPTPTASSPAQSAQPEPPSQQAPATEPWDYSKQRLLDAWAAGDWSSLATEDQAILDICREVVDTVVPPSGTAYAQELAVHDWMLAHGSYDSNRLSLLPDFQENPNNDNPYGFLVDGKGICLGYSSTFQLFMELLGIECVTVEGTAYGGTAAHAWNQVRLDGEWYCVDVTWDDPTTSGTVSERSAHRFFNVTSQYMRETDHQWDEAAVPEAEGAVWAWQ